MLCADGSGMIASMSRWRPTGWARAARMAADLGTHWILLWLLGALCLTSRSLARGLAGNARLPRLLLWWLAPRRWDVRAAVAANPRCPQLLLRLLSLSDVQAVGAAVAGNPAASQRMLDLLVRTCGRIRAEMTAVRANVGVFVAARPHLLHEQITSFAAHQPGALAGGWLRWAEAVLRPRLDWRTLLAAKIRSAAASVAGAADYSYSRPARRRVPRVVLPAMRRPIPRVAVIVDTSGSVDDHLLMMAWTEVHGCLRQLGLRRDMLTVYAADTKVHQLPGAPRRQVRLPGGGGTDMAAAIDVVLATRPIPDIVVVITDGLTPWPREKPRRDVIVALLPASFPRPLAPGWARVVEID